MNLDRDDLCIQMQRELKNEPEDTRIPISKAALFLGCSKSTLDHLRLDGGGPNFQYVGNRVFYPLGELRKYAASPLFNNTAEAKVYAKKIVQSYCLSPPSGYDLHPFWVRVSTGRILGSVFQLKENIRQAFLSPDVDVLWLRCRDALIAPWEDNNEFRDAWGDLARTGNVTDIVALKTSRIEADSTAISEQLKKSCATE